MRKLVGFCVLSLVLACGEPGGGGTGGGSTEGGGTATGGGSATGGVSVPNEWSTRVGAPDFIGRVVTTTLDYEAGFFEGTVDFSQNSTIQGSAMPTFDLDGTWGP